MPREIENFFDKYVHDSMAGLAQQKVNEFLINGIGIAKFRRIFFGNNGDAMLRDAVRESNEHQLQEAQRKQAQKEKWAVESEEYNMMVGH